MPPPPGGGSSGVVIAVVIGLAVILVTVLGAAVFLLTAEEGTPTAGPSASASPSESPSPSPSPSPSATGPTGDKISYTEYDKDWKFKLGEVELSAKYVDGWDHEDCEEIEKGGALSDLGCLYGVEVTYKAEDGKVVLSHLILAMTDEDAADEAVKDVDDDDFQLNKKSYLSDFTFGKWQRDSAGAYLVITVCTAKKSVSEKKASNYLKYGNADFTTALLWR